jgi:hypothetical protein
MSKDLVREIAEQIFREQILSNWRFYALLLAVWLLGTVTSAFIVSYIRKRAETYATKADLSELLQQLRATTTAAEEVKSAISHSDWSTREWKTLRKIKLEELLTTVYEVRQWFDKDVDGLFFNEPRTGEKSPIWKLKVISNLYFPELSDEALNLEAVYYHYIKWTLDVQRQLLSAKENAPKRRSIIDAMAPDVQAHSQYLLDATLAIEQKAPKLMQEIMGV